jgi:hypothetical protein
MLTFVISVIIIGKGASCKEVCKSVKSYLENYTVPLATWVAPHMEVIFFEIKGT